MFSTLTKANMQKHCELMKCVCVVPLQELRESLEVLVHQTRSLMMNPDSDHHLSLLLRQQLEDLDRATCELQVTLRLSTVQ